MEGKENCKKINENHEKPNLNKHHEIYIGKFIFLFSIWCKCNGEEKHNTTQHKSRCERKGSEKISENIIIGLFAKRQNGGR